MAGGLMGAAEIGERLGGVSRQRVYQITSHASFPRPVAALKVGNIWAAADVEAWVAERRPGLAAGPTRRKAEPRIPSTRHQWTLAELHRELDRYEQALVGAGRPGRAVATDVDRPRRFLRWLVGEYDPVHGQRS